MSLAASSQEPDHRAPGSAGGREAPLTGARWIARSTPERLVRVATEFFQSAGFSIRAGATEGALDEHSSEWIATALEIVEEKRETRSWWSGVVSGGRSRRMPRSAHGLPPTLVVAAARHVVTGVAELVVFPHASGEAEEQHAHAAGPLIASTLTLITEAAGAEGAMLSHEPLSRMPDDGAPMSSGAVRDVLGWR